MEFLTKALEDIPQFESIIKCLSENETPVSVKGMAECARPYFLHALAKRLHRRMVIVTYSTLSAKKILKSLDVVSGADHFFLSPREPLLHEVEMKNHQEDYNRVHGLTRLGTGDYGICVTTVDALCMRVSSRGKFLSAVLEIQKHMEYGMEDLCRRLAGLGYQRTSMVEGPGEFSRRGDILDIHSPGPGDPVRIEFFGEEVDLIRRFDVATQRSTEELESVMILPLSEQVMGRKERDALEEPWREAPPDRIFPLMEDIDCGFSYIGPDACIVLDNDLRCEKKMETVIGEYFSRYERLADKTKMPPFGKGLYCGMDEGLGSRGPHLVMPDISGYSSNIIPLREMDILTRENTYYRGNINLLLEDLKRWKSKKRKTIVFAPNAKSAGILSEYFNENGLNAFITREENPEMLPGTTVILTGGLSEGFEFPEAGLCFVGSGRIFHKESAREKERKKGKDINLFSSLKTGDYVVHDIHGIGRYEGMYGMEANGVKKDYLKILYRNGDVLYIPVSKMNLVQKFIGAEGKAPVLSRLGATEWDTTKKRVRESVKTIAFELVKLYARRKALKGHAYPGDTVWQVAFEEAFTYEETDDQLRCAEEIKKDMESDRPMDRLLCGDVGFGKTEVALRAVFKAVMDGKQVAFLVPTTVLAYQHYNNFRERMREYPVTTALLSRFRTREQQGKTLKDIRAGAVDVVVGTHRLLQKDVVFKDLGLLVIDEEQRFGVEHKEQIKNMKKDVDVLTLTATPIPRTLHMSLSGIRDISVIEDPPGKRFPIQTYVMEYDEDVVKDAIQREKARGGQVFYLYNRVKDIDIKYHRLRELLEDEDISIGIAHGQMDEKKLERTMIDFLEGTFDVLLCTTIIEAGLDMPNVNTLIVEDADRLGLSQLYQIRGRVGRSDKVAYAYITHKRNKEVTEDASKRLEAIREFTEFGSGFKIAMRDLEIRGAGNILGAAQHGHMEKVGYDMYLRLINQAVLEITGGEERASTGWEATVELNIDAYISGEYIEDPLQRMDIYRKIAVLSSEEDKTEIFDELIDRYGDIPGEVELLADIALVKNMATKAGIEKISDAPKGALFLYATDRKPDYSKLAGTLEKLQEKVVLKGDHPPGFLWLTHSMNRELLVKMKKILETMLVFE
ncbi:MAG: transcription-repair coupling factor [Clostridia bacterium]